MRDDRRIIINPEPDHRSEDGLAKMFGIVFWLVMIVGVIDYGLTAAWRWSLSTWDWLITQLPL